MLRKFTKIHEDSSFGIVLSAFYALGICLLTRIQKMGYSDQSGLDSFMFGQVTSLSLNHPCWFIHCSCFHRAILFT